MSPKSLPDRSLRNRSAQFPDNSLPRGEFLVFRAKKMTIPMNFLELSLYLSLFLENPPAEAANGELHLQCIDSWIWDRESGVGNVNVLQSNAQVSV